MSREQWALLAAFLATVAFQIGTLAHWEEAVTPPFVGATLGQLALLIRGFFTEKPSGGS